METAAAVLGNGAAINGSAGAGVLSIGAASASAAEESALSTEPGHRRRIADAAVRAVPAGRDAVGQAGRDPLAQPSTRSSLPRAAASRPQHSDRPEESTQVVAQREIIKMEPAAAADGPASMSVVAEPGQAAGNSSGATPGPSELPPPEDFAAMRRLVAQLAGKHSPPAQLGERSPQPLQQAAPAEAADGTAASALHTVQQPGMSVDPRPTRMYSLTRGPTRAAGHEQAVRTLTPLVGGAQADVQQVPVSPGTGMLLPAPTEMPITHLGLEAWLRALPPVIRKEVETVKELVLPLKKLRLLADIDAHLYNFSKSGVASSECLQASLDSLLRQGPFLSQTTGLLQGPVAMISACCSVLHRA